MDFVFPYDVRDLKIQIGVDILATSMHESGVSASVDMALLKARDQDHVEAAEGWRNENPVIFSEIGMAAKEALHKLQEGSNRKDQALWSLAASFKYVCPEAYAELDHHKFSYLAQLFGKMGDQDGAGMVRSLTALVAFGEGG